HREYYANPYRHTRDRLISEYIKSLAKLRSLNQHQLQPCSSFPLYNLPVELRLEVYSHCTAFTLLQLTHTSSLLRSEIRAHPSIIKNSYGYLSSRFVEKGLSRRRFRKEPLEFIWSWKFGEHPDPLRYDGTALSIRHIS